MAGQDEQLKQFCDITGEPEDRARFFLEASGWNLQVAQETFFDQSTAKPDTTQFSQSQTPSSSGGKVSSLSDFGRHDNSEDDSEKFFAGGSEHSGQYITGPPKQPQGDVSGDELVKNVFTAAKSFGTVVEDTETTSGGASTFSGAGFRLGDTEGPSEQVSRATAALPPPPEAHKVLYFWKNGFSIDSGPLRDTTTDADREFLKSVMKGEIPQELLAAAKGGKVELTMEDKRNEDYNPPKPKMVAFSGQGHTLGNITPALAEPKQSAAAAPPTQKSTPVEVSIHVNKNEPVTKIQIKLSDGSRLMAQFNHTHTISDIRAYINKARPDIAATSYILKTAFPNKELINETETIASAKLINAVVVQHPK